jgi:hypothetical protein
MFDELNKYQNNGHFFFEKGSVLSQISKDVPELPGVYYILRLAKGKIDLVYIGKSGTIEQNGGFKNQLLRKRLNNKQEKDIKRQDFFEQKIDEENIDALDIYWFVTFDEDHQDLPGYVEGVLIQRYFETFGELPPWNKSY